MPDETRRRIAQALVGQAARQGRKQFAPSVNAKRGQPLCGLPEHGRRRAEARAFIVNVVRHAIQSNVVKPYKVMEDFVVLYRRRKAPVPEWVYAALRKISRPTIWVWMQKLDAKGLRGLAGEHEKRRPKSPFNLSPKLKDFVLGMLHDYPHVSSAEVHRGIKGRFGPGGKEEGAAKPPSLRATERWIMKWKGENALAILARKNPDAARSRYGVAFGDAAAHVASLNGEWQSDGTLAELMLSDGRRHTLNLVIDVYSRRLRFHVSRTSSSAAVASCLRKAIRAWGVPDVWKTDNGKDYTSKPIERVMAGLQIFHETCPPFSPEKKPFVERAFKTFLHSHVEVMAGYSGRRRPRPDYTTRGKSWRSRPLTTCTPWTGAGP
jgi:transposase InsO family protein